MTKDTLTHPFMLDRTTRNGPPEDVDTSLDALMSATDEYLDALAEAERALARLRDIRDRYEWERQQPRNEPDPMDGADHSFEVENDY